MALPSTLVIRTVTETLPGAVRAEPDVDLSCELDEDHLPVLNGSRVRARLRDAVLTRLNFFDEEDQRRAHELFPPEHSWGEPVVTGFTARLREPERSTLLAAMRREPPTHRLDSDQLLQMLTVVRHRTANDQTGAPQHGTLRSERRLRPGVEFHARLRWNTSATEEHAAVLASAALGMRQIGRGGSGQVTAYLDDREQTVARARTIWERSHTA